MNHYTESHIIMSGPLKKGRRRNKNKSINIGQPSDMRMRVNTTVCPQTTRATPKLNSVAI